MKKMHIIEQIILITIIIAFISISIISISLVAGDEFINYFNTYKIYDGETIYKDVNIISTPLLFYIGMIFFKILGPCLIVFRIYNIFINIIVAISIYKIFRSLKTQKIYSIIYTLVLEILIANYVVIWGPTYNILGLLLCLIGINFYINKEKSMCYNVKHGIIIFLIIMSKQNIGIYYSLAYIIIELILNKKEGMKNLLKTFVITLFSCTLYLMYLYFNGNLVGFIGYTVLGLKEFSQNIFIDALDYIIIDILIILFIVFVLYKKKYNPEDFNSIITVLVFGICLLPIGYPIADRWHMIVASMVLIICFFYVIHNIIIIELNVEYKKLNTLIIIIVVFMIISSLYKINLCYGKVCTDSNSKFYLIPIENETAKDIQLMEEYLLKENKKVIIVSPEAGMYKINMEFKGDGEFDIPFLGNLGKDGEYGLINEVKKYNNTYFLIHTKKKYWQESDKLREYIKNNYQIVGNINDFDIYYIKE